MSGGSYDSGVGFSDGSSWQDQSRRGKSNLTKKLKSLALVGAITIIPIWAGHSYFGLETVRTKITDAQMTKVDGRYMVATEAEPFENHDAKYRFKWNSGKIQNEAIRLKGHDVEMEVYGWRLPLFSMYRNIRSIQEINSPLEKQ
jgi:hypothetical protein